VIEEDGESPLFREEGKLYQDQLYRAKTLSPLAIAIIDTPEFQRLGSLRQLGFSEVIYRGARHSRLEHSIGTYLICRQMMRRIVQNHDRFGLPHPGSLVSPNFRIFPQNSGLGSDPRDDTKQARWRGVMEVVGAAALLHDIGHVPFGHTLEDEFTGIYSRHDVLGGHRVYTMLFDSESDLARVFTDHADWLKHIRNTELRQLIYLILSWKEEITPSARHFRAILNREIKAREQPDGEEGPELARLKELRAWHSRLSSGTEPMFQPFMSDIVGNTICADLLDYLPRDRSNLGMEYLNHERVQRYFTIREGTLHKAEGYRMSIMVTRKGHGGQRRDVASAVLQIMRERFEMAEAVYYHHKKAAASAMLAKLAELHDDIDREPNSSTNGTKVKPRDDDAVYPAPWAVEATPVNGPPHMLHLSDGGLIDYLGVPEHLRFKDPERAAKANRLQRQLYIGLRFRRDLLYRTLLVIDRDLVNDSKYIVSSFVAMWRGEDGSPDSRGRRDIEAKLAAAAGAEDGEVLLYCPSAKMQSKEIHARLEIEENRIVPLSTLDSFVYAADVKTLTENYRTLWRSYLFVTPRIFKDSKACRAIIEKFCDEYDIDPAAAFDKARGHRYRAVEVRAQPELAFDQAAMMDEEEILVLLRPLMPESDEAEKRLRTRLSKLVTRANQRPGTDRTQLRQDLSSWARRRVRSSGELPRLDVKALEREIEKIFVKVIGDGSEPSSQ
jgi:HD superfamily phosphohydrolase